MQDESRGRGAEDREEPKESGERDAPEVKPSVISVVQQNAVIINGRIATRRDRNGEWI